MLIWWKLLCKRKMWTSDSYADFSEWILKKGRAFRVCIGNRVLAHIVAFKNMGIWLTAFSNIKPQIYIQLFKNMSFGSSNEILPMCSFSKQNKAIKAPIPFNLWICLMEELFKLPNLIKVYGNERALLYFRVDLLSSCIFIRRTDLKGHWIL